MCGRSFCPSVGAALAEAEPTDFDEYALSAEKKASFLQTLSKWKEGTFLPHLCGRGFVDVHTRADYFRHEGSKFVHVYTLPGGLAGWTFVGAKVILVDDGRHSHGHLGRLCSKLGRLS